MRKIRLLSQTLSVALILTSGTVSAQMGGGMGPGGQHGHDFEDFPGWQGHEIEHNVVLPQVAVGNEITMTLVVTNMGGTQRMGWFDDEEDYTVRGTLRFFASDGSPMLVRIEGVSASEFPLELGASEVSYLEVSAPIGNELQRGWLLVEFDDDSEHNWGFMDGHDVARGERVMVSAYYSIFSKTGKLESQVAIRPMTFRQGFFAHSITPVQFTRTDSGRIRTGIAVVNTSDEEASLTLRLVDKTGTPILTKATNLAAGAQLAQFIDEIFDSLEEGFQGVLELSTDGEGIVSMGLLQTGLVTTSIPTHHYGNWQQNQ